MGKLLRILLEGTDYVNDLYNLKTEKRNMSEIPFRRLLVLPALGARMNQAS